MRRALELAHCGRWTTPPNPAVGAVVVAGDEVIGEGFHRRPGTPHAEVVALEQAGKHARGATIFITLEPCDHHGRTPPCTEAIIRSGIVRVVIPSEDPCRRVRGQGITRLREAGIEVSEGIEKDAARELNERHFKAACEDRPVVISKIARTLDGRTMLPGRKRVQITGETALELVGQRRSEVDAVLIGSGTMLTDDPLLNARKGDGTLHDRQPLRVIADGRLRTSARIRMLHEPGGDVCVVTSLDRLGSREADALEAAGARLIGVDTNKGNMLDPRTILVKLGAEGVDSVLVEGGGTILHSFLIEDLVDLWEVWIAPLVTGSGGSALRYGMEPPLHLGPMSTFRAGEDLLVRALPAGL